MTPLPESTLEELKALLAKATPGPWTVFENELRSSQHCGGHVVVESDTMWWFNKDLTNLKLLEALRNTAEALIAEVEAGRKALKPFAKAATCADIIQFPTTVEKDALSIVREYFDVGPIEHIDPQLVAGDRFLAWLWLRGFKVVPLTDEDQ